MIGWDKINEVEKEYPGLQFESHSYDLHGFDEDGNEPWVTATEKMLEKDFQKMDEYGFRYMAYPYGGYNDLMLKAIGKSKIKMAFTFKETGYATRYYPVYEIPRQKVTAETTYEEFVEMLEKVAGGEVKWTFDIRNIRFEFLMICVYDKIYHQRKWC